jgi:hypothetical protein
MRRRVVVSRALALATAGTAGCLGGTGSDGDASEGPPALVEQSLSVTGGECGNGQDDASASFGDGRVEITGTISARDRCQGARVQSATYDVDADRLSVTVETEKAGDVCAQCISDVYYEATFSFEGELPGSLVLTHERRGRTRTVLKTTRGE